MDKIFLYNVSKTAEDTAEKHGYSSWIEAIESKLFGIKLRTTINGEDMVGAHMSSHSGQSGIENTEYIAYIRKSDNSDNDNTTPIPVEYFVRYDDVK